MAMACSASSVDFCRGRFHRCGSSSPIWLARCWAGVPSHRADRRKGCPLMRADWIKLMTAAARWPARRLPAKSQLFRPMAIGRIWFSIQLLSPGSCPSPTNRVSASQRRKQ